MAKKSISKASCKASLSRTHTLLWWLQSQLQHVSAFLSWYLLRVFMRSYKLWA